MTSQSKPSEAIQMQRFPTITDHGSVTGKDGLTNAGFCPKKGAKESHCVGHGTTKIQAVHRQKE
jgi:hypothetical protein